LTIKFLDGSAFVKLFLQEPASNVLRRDLRHAGDSSKAISTIARVEARSALQRRYRNREISLSALQTAIIDLNAARARWVRVSPEEAVIEATFEIIARHALKSLDALQLASAISLRDEVAP